MTKLCLITDTHWGVRNDNIAFLDMTKRFLDEVFFPELKSRGITNIVHLGDLVDKRKSINILTLNRLIEDFLDQIKDHGCRMVVITGNHDTYHKSTNSINALEPILFQYGHDITYVIDQPQMRHGILYVPWICDDNRERTIEAIGRSDARFVFGHLELAGSQMYRGVVNEHGDDRQLFAKFDGVYTGHFHHKSSVGNIHYLGSHGQFTWSDYGDQRGFHVFDTETGELEFIHNPFDMFIKIGYDDTAKALIWNLQEDSNDLDVTNKYVKIVVRNKTKQAVFDKMMAALQEQKPLDIQIIDEAFNTEAADSLDLAVNTEDTMSIFKQHIDSLEEPDVPKAELERYIFDLYKRAKELVS